MVYLRKAFLSLLILSDNLYSLKAWVTCMSHVHGARAL